MNAPRQRLTHERLAKMVAWTAVVCGAGMGADAAPIVFPQGVHQTYAVTTDNRLYAYDMNTHALTLRHTISGLQPGETIRGIDFKHIANDPAPPTDLYLLGSTGTVYLLDYNAQSGSYTTSSFAHLFGFAATGSSVGFDVRYQPWAPSWGPPGEYPFIYASRDDGRLMANGPVQNAGQSTAHYADGSPAFIGGLASYDDSSFGNVAPPWGLIGIDTVRQQFVNVDPHHPPNGYGGPTLGLCKPMTTFTGPTGAMDLSQMAGFDLQEWFEQTSAWNFRSDVYGVMALNEAGSTYTSLYAMRTDAFGLPFGAPIAFEKVGDLVLDDPGPVRFSAVAMIPTPGAAVLVGAGLLIGTLRRRRNA
ncbi:MAG: hypothetical protein ACKVZJ_07545 [Phycisphaerales bacterium]